MISFLVIAFSKSYAFGKPTFCFTFFKDPVLATFKSTTGHIFKKNTFYFGTVRRFPGGFPKFVLGNILEKHHKTDLSAENPEMIFNFMNRCCACHHKKGT